MGMRDKRRIENDINNIFSRFGYSEFFWRDVRDCTENSPVYYSKTNSLICVGMKNNNKIYRINPAYFDNKSPYKLKKSSLYPKKTWIGKGEVNYA